MNCCFIRLITMKKVFFVPESGNPSQSLIVFFCYFRYLRARSYHAPALLLESISPTYLRVAFTPVAPKSVRIQSSVSIFLRFWDLRIQKLLVECWWNWHLLLLQKIYPALELPLVCAPNISTVNWQPQSIWREKQIKKIGIKIETKEV